MFRGSKVTRNNWHYYNPTVRSVTEKYSTNKLCIRVSGTVQHQLQLTECLRIAKRGEDRLSKCSVFIYWVLFIVSISWGDHIPSSVSLHSKWGCKSFVVHVAGHQERWADHPERVTIAGTKFTCKFWAPRDSIHLEKLFSWRHPVQTVIFSWRHPVQTFFSWRYPVKTILFSWRHPVQTILFSWRHPVQTFLCWRHPVETVLSITHNYISSF